MAKVEITETGESVAITYSGTKLGMDQVLVKLRGLLSDLRSVIPIVDFKLTLLTGYDWRYRYEAVDGRVWVQTLRIPPGGPVTMSSSGLNGFWSLEEFNIGRPLRAYVIDLVVSQGVTKIDALFA
jgi:hypothetical protein